MEKRYRLELVGITYNQIESGVYALILQQVGATRRIPIIIGFPEAQAIECKLQEVATPRPLTHDTMVATLASFGISLIEVNIYKLPNGVFAADLVFSDGKTEGSSVDEEEKGSVSSSTSKKSDLAKMSISQLSEAMLLAAENEDYEEAARIKNEIDNRNAQKE